MNEDKFPRMAQRRALHCVGPALGFISPAPRYGACWESELVYPSVWLDLRSRKKNISHPGVRAEACSPVFLASFVATRQHRSRTVHVLLARSSGPEFRQ